MKVALTGLHEIRVTRNVNKPEKDRTLQETELRSLLDRLRPLAKDEASKLTLVPADGLKDKTAANFIALFL